MHVFFSCAIDFIVWFFFSQAEPIPPAVEMYSGASTNPEGRAVEHVAVTEEVCALCIMDTLMQYKLE